MKNIDMNQVNVPSLYVRVYRADALLLIQKSGSLIICEGVSEEKRMNEAFLKFPHYM